MDALDPEVPATAFHRAQNTVVGGDQPSPALSDGLLEKLAASVPSPRFHLLRYHGVLAHRTRDRHRIVPTQPVAESTAADRASSAPPWGHRLGVGGPARPRVCHRPQRLRDLWRAPADGRRPDRSGFDPDLAGGGRAAGGAPARAIRPPPPQFEFAA